MELQSPKLRPKIWHLFQRHRGFGPILVRSALFLEPQRENNVSNMWLDATWCDLMSSWDSWIMNFRWILRLICVSVLACQSLNLTTALHFSFGIFGSFLLHPANFDVIRFKPQKWTTIQILGVTRCTCTYTSKYIFCVWVVCVCPADGMQKNGSMHSTVWSLATPINDRHRVIVRHGDKQLQTLGFFEMDGVWDPLDVSQSIDKPDKKIDPPVQVAFAHFCSRIFGGDTSVLWKPWVMRLVLDGPALSANISQSKVAHLWFSAPSWIHIYKCHILPTVVPHKPIKHLGLEKYFEGHLTFKGNAGQINLWLKRLKGGAINWLSQLVIH